jgi:PQQ-dependent dehydrogenase (methanol/ethanol family)
VTRSGAWKVSASAVAMAAGCGLASTASANDDVLALQDANVVQPSITYNGWNYSPFDQINLDNVANLSLAWTLQLGVLDQWEASPLVVGDMMFVVSPVNQSEGTGQAPNTVLALDLNNDGAIVWEFRPDVDREASLRACCGSQTRGLQYAEGKIFFVTMDGQAFGLDAETGEALWRSVGADVTISEHTAGNGIVVGDLYIIGNAGGEFGVRGKVTAFDIDTGRTQWVMYNMGPDNEVGIGPRFNPFYADDRQGSLNTWWGDSWRHGGGTVWGYFTYDPDLDMLYYSTGNCGPWNPDYRREWGVVNLDENGGLIDYRNNWCASQLARDATSGELIWAYNMSPADMWDIDEPLITPLLDLDMNGNGTLAHTAVKAARNGYFYVWDRQSGQLLNQPWPFVAVTNMTGVDTETGRALYDISKWMFTNVEDRQRYLDPDGAFGADRIRDMRGAEYTGTEATWCPGLAARNWQNDAWSPQTGLLYTVTDTSCSTMLVVEGDYNTENYRNRQFVGGNLYIDAEGNPLDYVAELQANDPVAGETRWSVRWSVGNNAPVMASAGGLVWEGASQVGELRAYNAATGEQVWAFRTGSSFSQSPISYIGPDGRQYIAIIASASNTGQVAFDNAADDADRYRRAGTTLFVFALPQSVAGGM